MELAHLLINSLATLDAPRHNVQEVVDATRSVTGFDIRRHTRRREYVSARAVAAYVARCAGNPLNAIAEGLGLHHSSVVHLVRLMEQALSLSTMYPDYIDLYNKLTTILK